MVKIRNEVETFIEHVGYDSDREEENANAAIRKRKYNAYEKRQELRKQGKP